MALRPREGPQDFINILRRGYAAQQFSEMIAHHKRRGMQGAVTRGRLHTSAYGYVKLDTTEGLNLGIDPEEAKIVRWIFAETAEGRSAKTIAVRLNADGIPAPRGGTWGGSTIRGNKARHEGILNNRLYFGEAPVCKFCRKYLPDTGEKVIFATEDDAELEVCCTRFGCSEARKGACRNRITIAQGRIEARVFDGLRELSRSKDLIRAFENAFQEEMRQLEGEDTDGGLMAAGRKLAKVQKARGGIMKAIEAGADFTAYSARDKALEVGQKALATQLSDLKSRQAVRARTAPDIPAVFSQAMDELEALLGTPDTVAQASEYLSMLIGNVTLTPNPEAESGLDIDVSTDLAALQGDGPPGF